MMFALVALICFILALFGVHTPVDLVILGLAFVALHLLWEPSIPWRRSP